MCQEPHSKPINNPGFWTVLPVPQKIHMYKISVSVSLKISKFTVLGRIHTNQLINCCSDVSTIVFSNQSSVFFYYFVVASKHVRESHNHTHPKGAAP